MDNICSLCGHQDKKLNASQVTSQDHNFMFHLCDDCVGEILRQLKVPPRTFSINQNDLPILNKQFAKTLKKLQGKIHDKNKKLKK